MRMEIKPRDSLPREFCQQLTHKAKIKFVRCMSESFCVYLRTDVEKLASSQGYILGDK